jgi:methionyl-tRNA formyltransferase
VRDRHVLPVVFDNVDLIFLVGWQYLLAEVDERMVIVHDSLLPRYRGWAPTVTALINGEPELGVTALRPVAAVDAGPVLGQRRWTVRYPMAIADALDQQAAHMADLLLDVVAAWEDGRLMARPQDESQATYSLWRDGDDGWIDWSWDAARISRFVDAVGFPYSGARTSYDGAELTVHRVEVVDDLRFEDRVPGKIWSLTSDGPIVVCGTGMVRISEARDPTGAQAVFGRRRRRLGVGGRAHAHLAP